MKPLNVMTGVGAALGAAYLLDPRNGRRRRTEIAQKLGKFERRKVRAIQSAWEDARHRMAGSMYDLKSAMTREGQVDDSVIEARIRSEIGHVCAHPGAIQVSSTDGFVDLKGDVLASDVQNVMQSAKLVRGVKAVDNQMAVHETADIPALQGGRHISQATGMIKPSTALAIGAAGLALMLMGAAKRGTAGKLLGVMGLGLAAKGLSDIEGNRAFGD